MKRIQWLALLLIALIALVAAGCGDDDDGDGGDEAAQQREFPAGSTMADLQEEGEVTIGVKFDVPPFGFKSPQTGDVEGFDVDLGKAIADELGVEPKFIEAISDNRIPFLEDGTADLILSTMTITRERDTEIDFSEPYYIARGRILAPKGSDIAGIEDLDGKRVCTALGSTYADTIKQSAPGADLRLVDSYSECLELIQTDAVDAISTDDVILTGMIAQDDSLELVGPEFTFEPYGVGIPQGDRELKEFVDGVVERFIADGQWQETYDKWVGQYLPESERQSPPTLSLEEALRRAPE